MFENEHVIAVGVVEAVDRGVTVGVIQVDREYGGGTRMFNTVDAPQGVRPGMRVGFRMPPPGTTGVARELEIAEGLDTIRAIE